MSSMKKVKLAVFVSAFLGASVAFAQQTQTSAGAAGAVTTEGLVGVAAAVGVLGVTVSTGNKH